MELSPPWTNELYGHPPGMKTNLSPPPLVKIPDYAPVNTYNPQAYVNSLSNSFCWL